MTAAAALVCLASRVKPFLNSARNLPVESSVAAITREKPQEQRQSQAPSGPQRIAAIPQLPSTHTTEPHEAVRQVSLLIV